MNGLLKASWLRSIPQVSCIRMFSNTTATKREFAYVVGRKFRQPRQIKENDPDTFLPSKPPAAPLYPYGPSLIYKQSNRGLYGGKYLQFGNKISEKFNQKSGRVFHPNVQKTVLWSDALNSKLRIKLVTSVLRTITKEGGLDNYLTKDTPSRIKELGPFGWNLRYRVLKRLEEKERTKPKLLEGLKVGKAKLIKDLFIKGGKNEGETFKQFRLRHRDATADELLTRLDALGIQASNYREVE